MLDWKTVATGFLAICAAPLDLEVPAIGWISAADCMACLGHCCLSYSWADVARPGTYWLCGVMLVVCESLLSDSSRKKEVERRGPVFSYESSEEPERNAPACRKDLDLGCMYYQWVAGGCGPSRLRPHLQDGSEDALRPGSRANASLRGEASTSRVVAKHRKQLGERQLRQGLAHCSRTCLPRRRAIRMR